MNSEVEALTWMTLAKIHMMRHPHEHFHTEVEGHGTVCLKCWHAPDATTACLVHEPARIRIAA